MKETAPPLTVSLEVTPLQIVLIGDPASSKEVHEELQRAGYAPTFHAAKNLRQLSDLLTRCEGELLLLEDLHIPIYGVMKVLERHESDIPVIVLVGEADEDEATQAVRAGASDYLQRDNLRRLGSIVARELRDATERRERHKAEEALRESNAILQATQEAAGEGICLVSREGKVVSFNSFFACLWNLTLEQANAMKTEEQLLFHILSQMRDPDEWVENINYLFDHPAASTRGEVALKDGRTLERHSAPATSPQGKSYGRVWSFKDITPHKNYQIQLAHQAFHDPVTKLPNRALFIERLERTVARVRRAPRAAAVLFLDLDRFKVVNDSLGHAKGDELLVEVAHRLQGCLRPGDTAARFGGDEFTILLEDIASTHDAIAVAERVADAISSPFQLGTQEVHVSTSIGIVVADRHADSADELLRKADVAMYRAKQKGRAQYALFDMEMSAQALERLQMEVDLRRSIKQRELTLQFQPIIDLQRGRMIGTEALVRWNHPQRGLVPPFEFVALAEEIGMILPIGQWVMRGACSWTQAWQLQQLGFKTKVPDEPMLPGGIPVAPLTVSVNLSARQFQRSSLAEEVAQVLLESGLPASSLTLEITESTVMDDISTTVAQLEALKRLGVQLAVDDFGTGYSSLAYLERFPIDILKVDRAFVSRVGERGERLAIIQAICTLGSALGMRVTAEGLETGAQVSHLRRIGCRAGQGYYFSKPLPADEMTALIERNSQW